MEEEHISKDDEMHMKHLEDEAEDIYNEDEFICGHCCKTMLTEELETRDRIRSIVMPGTMIYGESNIRKFLTFLAMYPSFATVSEVVEDMTAYHEDCVSD